MIIHDKSKIFLMNFKGNSSLEMGFIYCPILPDGTDMRLKWIEEKKKIAKDNGWCLKLFEEMYK